MKYTIVAVRMTIFHVNQLTLGDPQKERGNVIETDSDFNGWKLIRLGFREQGSHKREGKNESC